MSPALVEVRTANFAFTIAVCVAEAPISGSYFLSDVDSRAFDGTTIFRQMGRRETDPAIPVVIQHEPTSVTGLRHQRGTVSLARFAPGAVCHSWFVCMRDEPALDEGGARNPDGRGFAAFGYVVKGFEHLQRLFEEHAKGPEHLTVPIPLESVRRV
jgi:peptidyl-prolyl cis-trans isomerase A (cyclophilin A)